MADISVLGEGRQSRTETAEATKEKVDNKWSRSDQASAYVANNVTLVSFVCTYVVVNGALFAARFFHLLDKPVTERIARSTGRCLNFNCALVLVLMLRRSITWLRCQGLGQWLPLDSHTLLHKLCGWVTLVLSLVHTAMHFANYVILSQEENSYSVSEFLFSTRPGIGWVGGVANSTGLSLLVILLVMIAFSQPCVRRSGCFEVFYWTHLLYVAFWVLLIIHGPCFWQWFALPGFVYLVELFIRVRRRTTCRTYIIEGVVLPSKVTQLIIRRPNQFRFRPGDYVLVNLPAVSNHEWHPFTLSSAPEQNGLLSLHVRAVGEWTNGVYDYFDSRCNENTKTKTDEEFKWRFKELLRPDQSSTFFFRIRNPFTFFRNNCTYEVSGKSRDSHVAADTRINVQTESKIEIYLDGPFGTPTSNVFGTRNAILVAAGIGVTPYASVLQSLLLRYWSTHRTFNKCSECTCPLAITDLGAITGPVKLRRVHFIWINRDLSSLDWFLELLCHLKVELGRRRCPILSSFLSIDLYVTRSEKLPPVPDPLRGCVHVGRPDWDQVLPSFVSQPRRKTTVFCCGPRSLSRELRKKCVRYGVVFKKETF